jgi:hypothetical protein
MDGISQDWIEIDLLLLLSLAFQGTAQGCNRQQRDTPSYIDHRQNHGQQRIHQN